MTRTNKWHDITSQTSLTSTDTEGQDLHVSIHRQEMFSTFKEILVSLGPSRQLMHWEKLFDAHFLPERQGDIGPEYHSLKHIWPMQGKFIWHNKPRKWLHQNFYNKVQCSFTQNREHYTTLLKYQCACYLYLQRKECFWIRSIYIRTSSAMYNHI